MPLPVPMAVMVVGWVPSLGSPLLSVRTVPVVLEAAAPWLLKVWLSPVTVAMVTSKDSV